MWIWYCKHKISKLVEAMGGEGRKWKQSFPKKVSKYTKKYMYFLINIFDNNLETIVVIIYLQFPPFSVQLSLLFGYLMLHCTGWTKSRVLSRVKTCLWPFL